MPTNPQIDLDATDTAILRELQHDGRMTVADLARAVSLSASATADRLRRLTDAGVITGYRASVDPSALGYGICAFVRLAYPSGQYGPLRELVAGTPEIVEAHHVTGVDCFVFKVLARSMADLERLTGRLAVMGSITTSVVYSSLVEDRPVAPA